MNNKCLTLLPGAVTLFTAVTANATLTQTILSSGDTNKYMERANDKEPAIMTLPGEIPLGGGSPVVYQGQVIGAVGASGSLNPNGIAIAKASADSFK